MAKDISVFEESIRNFLEPIWIYLKDESITEVMINGPKDIFIERGGYVEKIDASFPDEDSLRAAINNVAQSVGRRIHEDSPRLDARLPNGYRIHAVIPPCARNGTTVAIRKFSQVQMSLRDYIQCGSLNQDVAQFLDIAMKLGKNILVSGGTGSGKTTLLGALCGSIPKGQRLIVIEDSSELRINYDHVVSFETRLPDEQGEGEITVRDLLKSSLRLRPDRLVVGEVRGCEVLELIQAMNTGHKGCLGTIHANSSLDALFRMEALAQQGDMNLSEKVLRHQISEALDLVVQISRCSDGQRRVVEVSEVLGRSQGNKSAIYEVNSLFQISRFQKQSEGHFKAFLEPTGELPHFMEEIEDHNIPFPRSKFVPKKDSAA